MAIASAFAAALSTTLLFVLILMPFEQFESHLAFRYVRGVELFFRGFAFVFIGSMFALKRWRGIAAFALVLLGIGAFIYNHARYSSSHGLPIWDVIICVAGGSLAAKIQAWRARGQTGAGGTTP